MKTRLETCSKQIESNMFKNIYGIVKNEGVKGLFTGVVPNVMSKAPLASLH